MGVSFGWGALPPSLNMPNLRVAFLETDQGAIDGYRYRLERLPEFKIVFVARSGSEFEAQLDRHPTDLAVIDLSAPAAPANPNPYPIHYAMRRLRAAHPALAVLVTAHGADAAVLGVLIEAGLNGYLVKSDTAAYEQLPEILTMVARRDLYLSATAQASLHAANVDGANPLSPRQREILALCAAYPNDMLRDIARRLGLSASTVRNQMSAIYSRLGVRTRHAAVQTAQRRKLI